MKLTVLPEMLTKAAERAMKVATGGTYGDDLLKRVALQAVNGSLTVSGTDIARRVDLDVPAKIEEEGGVVLPPVALLNFLSTCRAGEPLTIACAVSRARLVCGRVTATISGHGIDQFPPLDLGDVRGPWLRLPARTLRAGLQATIHSAATDDSRPVLAGVELRSRDHTLTLSSANGFAISTWQAVEVDGDDLAVIVPARSLSLVLASLDVDEPATLDVLNGGDRVRLTLEGSVWTFQAIAGDMPNIRHFLDRKPSSLVVYERAELERALKLCVFFDQNSTGKDAVHRALMVIGDDSTRFVAEHTLSNHEAAIEIGSTIEAGEPQRTTTNAELLRNAVGCLSGERVALEIPGASDTQVTTIIAREVGERNGHLQAVIRLFDKRSSDATP